MNSASLLEKINGIQNYIISNLTQSPDIGILTGLSGYSLFFEYYSRYISNQPNEIDSEHILNMCVDKINDDYKKATYCDGICGLIWSLEFLKKKDFADFADHLNILNEYVKEWTYLAINQNNFDFLHGSTGGIYHLAYQATISNESIPLFSKYLVGLEGRYKEIYDYKSLAKEQILENRTYLGIAHGIAGYIHILAMLSKIPELKEKSIELIDKYFNLLLDTALFSKNKHSVFPSWLLQTTNLAKESSGLSWCLGDLGIGITLLNTSQIIHHKDMENTALNILYHSAERTSREQSMLNSPCLCHGYFGAYKIFSRAYSLTSENIFLKAKNHWLNTGLESIEKNIPNDSSILIGQTGIGLALIDAYTDTDLPWGECLLIS